VLLRRSLSPLSLWSIPVSDDQLTGVVATDCADDKSRGAISQPDLPHSAAAPQTKPPLHQTASAGEAQRNSSRHFPEADSALGSLSRRVLFHLQKRTPYFKAAFCFPLTGL